MKKKTITKLRNAVDEILADNLRLVVWGSQEHSLDQRIHICLGEGMPIESGNWQDWVYWEAQRLLNKLDKAMPELELSVQAADCGGDDSKVFGFILDILSPGLSDRAENDDL